MDLIRDSVQSTKDAITRATQTGTEPVSGVSGAGTADQPYDQGNAPEQTTSSGVEPPSGIQGKGTIDEPYDQGNQPENNTVEKSTLVQSTPSDPLGSPSTTHQGSGNPEMEPTTEQEKVIHETRDRDEAAQAAIPSIEPTENRSTGTASEGGNFDASKKGAGKEAERLRYEDRDVSPGEMRDGTHAVTSGDRGEIYQPSKMSKLKDKLHLGRER